MEAWEVLEKRKELFDPLLMYVTEITEKRVVFAIPRIVWNSVHIEEEKIRMLKRMFEIVNYNSPIVGDMLDFRIPMEKKMPVVFLVLANPINKPLEDGKPLSLE